MTARTLEQNGISTIVIGSAWDILERCGTPRVLYNDLPLGNPVGKPFDLQMQTKTMQYKEHPVMKQCGKSVAKIIQGCDRQIRDTTSETL